MKCISRKLSSKAVRLGLVAMAALTAANAAVAGVIETGKSVPVRAETGNRAVAVTIRNAAIADSYGDAKPAAGNQFLILATQWENVLPVKVTVENKSIPTGYKIPSLADHAYLVVDGRKLLRLSPDMAKLPGHLKVRDFGLPAMGDVAKGNLVFEIPAELAKSAKTFELHYFDLTHGHFRVQLAGDPASLEAKPLAQASQNQVLAPFVYGLERKADFAGRAVPKGMEFVLLDFRAESKFGVDADATAFDPNARPGSKTRKAIFADWTDWRKYAHLVLDGEYSYTAEPQSDLPELPRFIPEVATGGTLVFLVPQGAKSLELRLDFPNARSGTTVLRPTPLSVGLEARSTVLQERKALLTIDDDIFQVYLLEQSIVDEFAGAKSSTGKFMVWNVLVQNTRRDGEFFQTKQQLKLLDESGRSHEPASATWVGPRRPSEIHFIPGDSRRVFQLAFELPMKLQRPRLAYAGVSLAKTVDLPAIGGAAGATTQVAGSTTTKPAGGNTTGVAGTIVPAGYGKRKDALPVRVIAKQPHKPGGLPGVGLTPEQVNQSIDRGAKFLWEETARILAEKPTPNGHHGLYLLALVHADHHKKDPECEKAVRRYLAEASPMDMGIYATGVYLMLAESFGDAMYMPKIKLATKFLVESQGKGGTWGYNGNRKRELYAEPVPDLSEPLSVIGGRPLEGPGSDHEPIVRKSPMEHGEDGDNSSSQYAVLGLHSAARMGLKVPAETWKRALEGTAARQAESGGFAYSEGQYGYGSMTCAGLGTMLICRYHLGEKDPAASPAIERGFGWLDVKFSVSQNPESSSWLLYYLYGLERVGRIADTEFVGDHEWYPYGTKYLLGIQQADGGWKREGEEAEPPLATSFALLFLTRATPSLTAEKRQGPGILTSEMAPVKGHRVYIILDSTGTMSEQTDGVPRAQTARESMARLVDELPDATEVAVRAFGHRKSALDEGADTDTELLVPLQKMDRKKVVEKINALRPRGKTPLSLTLQQTTADLKGSTSREHPVTVILVTDGGGDNTRPKVHPLKAVEDLGKLPGVSLYVVGFDVKDPDWKQQLQDLSTRGRGQYVNCEKSDMLLKELRTAVFRMPEEFVVLDTTGKRLVAGPFGQQIKLQPGKYVVATSLGGYTFRREAWVNSNSTTVARFDPLKVDFSKPPEPGPAVTATQPAPPVAGPANPPAARPKFCTSCGKPLPATGKFCTNCGAKIPLPPELQPK